MSDPVLEVARGVAPLLAAGADGALAETLRQAGAGGAAAVRRVVDTLRAVLGGTHPDEQTVAATLRAQLEKGMISQSDLNQTANALGVGRDNYGTQVQGNAYINSSIDVKGDFKG